MELLQLRYFRDAALFENFSKVAEKYTVPQPSISKTIKKLENELGVSLFDRRGKSISLNENGKIFYKKINPALTSIDEGIEFFKQSREDNNIVIYTQAGNRFVSLLTADFLTSSKHIFISNVNHSSMNPEHPYDFTFIQKGEDMSGYNYVELMDDEIVAVISHQNPLSQKNILSLSELSNESFIAYYRSIHLRDFTDRYCQTVGGFTPIVVFETADYSSIRYMIDKNKGIALMPQKFFELQHSNKVALVPIEEKICRTLTIAWEEDKILNESEKIFLDFTKNWFRQF